MWAHMQWKTTQSNQDLFMTFCVYFMTINAYIFPKILFSWKVFRKFISLNLAQYLAKRGKFLGHLQNIQENAFVVTSNNWFYIQWFFSIFSWPFPNFTWLFDQFPDFFSTEIQKNQFPDFSWLFRTLGTL